MKLDEDDFYEKRLINKRKKWILEGLDPDEEEKKMFKRPNKNTFKKLKKHKDKTFNK